MENSVSSLFEQLLTAIGEDKTRSGLLETPDRVARMYTELTAGYRQDPKTIVKLFPAESSTDLITVTNIPFYSLCEHHLIPFFGTVHIGYIPGASILGLSKFARIVDVFARRLQVQERLTTQIADCLEELLSPKGLAVSIQAEHLCMSMRGVAKAGSVTYTETLRGECLNNPQLVSRFYQAVSRLHHE